MLSKYTIARLTKLTLIVVNSVFLVCTCQIDIAREQYGLRLTHTRFSFHSA